MKSMVRDTRMKSVARYCKAILCISLISAIVECAVFNYRYFESLTFQPVSYSIEGQYNADSGGFVVDGSHEVRVTFGGGENVSNLHINIVSGNIPDILIEVTDEGSSSFHTLVKDQPDREEYYRVHADGRAFEVRISSDSADSALILVECNVRAPFDFSLFRFFSMGLLLGVMWLVGKNSLLRFKSVNLSFVLLLSMFAVAVAMLLCWQGYDSWQVKLPHHHQYHELAIALSQGNTYLDMEPPKALLDLSNPYDTSARSALGIDLGQYWDHAYFEGRFYVYFGILPALLYHLPFYLLTGQEFPTVLGVANSIAFFIVGCGILVYFVCERWFPGCTQSNFFLAFLVVLGGSWIIYPLQNPNFYALPIVTGLAFLSWGLAFWIRATSDADTIRVGWAVAGSLCIALTIACRPQLIIGGVFGIALLMPYFRVMNKRHLRNIAIALLPFVVVFGLMGLYNYLRFGSPFDFGANYNLTTNDMTHRGFNIDRLPLAFFAYLLQFPNIVAADPYMLTTNLSSSYYGRTIHQAMYGGILALAPVLLLSACLLSHGFRKKMRNYESASACAVASIAAAIILVMFDANGAGILMRYFLDMGFFLGFSAMICVLVLVSTPIKTQMEEGREGSANPIGSRFQRYGASLSSVETVIRILLAITVIFQLLWYYANS